MISTRHKQNIPFYLLLAAASSFVLSLFLLQFFAGIVERAQSFSSGGTAYSSYLLAVLPVLIFLPFKKTDKRFLSFWVREKKVASIKGKNGIR